MNIAIIEDIKSDYETLRNILRDCFSEYTAECNIQWFETCEAFLGDFEPNKFNLIFFDVLLGEGMSGMETARKIRKEGCLSPIVFTTGERDYAIEGYEVQAIDYLIKPYETERIQSITKRIMNTLNARRYITVPVGRETRCICTEELLWAESSDHYMDFHMASGETLHVTMKFQEILEILSKQHQFQCCYRGIVVNLAYVDALLVADFLLQNGEKVPVSRFKREEMQKCLSDYAIYMTREEMKL